MGAGEFTLWGLCILVRPRKAAGAQMSKGPVGWQREAIGPTDARERHMYGFSLTAKERADWREQSRRLVDQPGARLQQAARQQGSGQAGTVGDSQRQWRRRVTGDLGDMGWKRNNGGKIERSL